MEIPDEETVPIVVMSMAGVFPSQLGWLTATCVPVNGHLKNSNGIVIGSIGPVGVIESAMLTGRSAPGPDSKSRVVLLPELQ